MATKIKLTEKGNSYWNESGAYQKESDELYEKHVPASGVASSTHGELIRAVNRLYYEYCNNGNCNAFDVETIEEEHNCSDCNGNGYVYDEDEEGNEIEIECEECFGSGYMTEETDGDVFITDFYQAFIDFIHIKLSEEFTEVDFKPMCENIENIIKQGPYHDSEYFNDDRMNADDLLIDWVMHYVLNTEDSQLPESYYHYQLEQK